MYTLYFFKICLSHRYAQFLPFENMILSWIILEEKKAYDFFLFCSLVTSSDNKYALFLSLKYRAIELTLMSSFYSVLLRSIYQ
jgi:hypothetical protein